MHMSESDSVVIKTEQENIESNDTIAMELDATSDEKSTSVAETQQLEEKSNNEAIESLKKSLALVCCNSILSPPIPFVGALRINNNDTPEEKEAKRKEYEEKLQFREKEKLRREPELVEEMNKIIKRVYDSRAEALPEDSGEYSFGAKSESLISKRGFSYEVAATKYGLHSNCCEVCGNKDPYRFFTDSSSGDTICLGVDGNQCGNVVAEHLIDRGAAKRNFEGEEDKSHHGPSPDKLMTDSENTRTVIVGGANYSGPGVSGGTDTNFKKLSQASAAVEMNLSKIGHDERKTRIGYKTQNKKKAFELIHQFAANFDIHSLVVERAKQEFSRYRDVKEAVQQFEGVVASCIIIAYKELIDNLGIDSVTRKKRVFVSTSMNSERTDSASYYPVPDPQDPAVSTLSTVMMRSWNLDQVKSWLNKVAEGRECKNLYDTCAMTLYNEVERVYSTQLVNGSTSGANFSKKRKYPTMPSNGFISGFGTTTLANRQKRLAAMNNSKPMNSTSKIQSDVVGDCHGTTKGDEKLSDHNASNPTTTVNYPGKYLVTIDIMEILTPVVEKMKSEGNVVMDVENQENEFAKCIDVFKGALRRRTKYEGLYAEAERLVMLESKRMHIENATIPVGGSVAEVKDDKLSKSSLSIEQSPAANKAVDAIEAKETVKAEKLAVTKTCDAPDAKSVDAFSMPPPTMGLSAKSSSFPVPTPAPLDTLDMDSLLLLPPTAVTSVTTVSTTKTAAIVPEVKEAEKVHVQPVAASVKPPVKKSRFVVKKSVKPVVHVVKKDVVQAAQPAQPQTSTHPVVPVGSIVHSVSHNDDIKVAEQQKSQQPLAMEMTKEAMLALQRQLYGIKK